MKGPFQGFKVANDRKLIGVVLKVKNVGKLSYDDPLPSGQLTGSVSGSSRVMWLTQHEVMTSSADTPRNTTNLLA